jgi:hypothetical protein
LAVLEYALSFTEFYRKNDENRIGGTSGCFDSFSNSFGESSTVILNKSPIYIISLIFFQLYLAENGIGNICQIRSILEIQKSLEVLS